MGTDDIFKVIVGYRQKSGCQFFAALWAVDLCQHLQAPLPFCPLDIPLPPFYYSKKPVHSHLRPFAYVVPSAWDSSFHSLLILWVSPFLSLLQRTYTVSIQAALSQEQSFSTSSPWVLSSYLWPTNVNTLYI